MKSNWFLKCLGLFIILAYLKPNVASNNVYNFLVKKIGILLIFFVQV